MKKLKRIVIVILLTQLLDIQAGCYWDSTSQMDCGIECLSESSEQVRTHLEEKWRERENCHSEGIYLKLSLTFPNYNVKANWFTAEVKVKELKFGLTGVTTMEANAFNSTALKSVTKLTFPNMDLTPIEKGIFNGLESLEQLVMEGAYLKVIETGVLDVLNGTLKRLTLVQSSKYWSAIIIDGFTGSAPLTVLEFVKFNYKLTSTLTHKSFVGLPNVSTLDLSDCQIETIGAGAFDPIGSSIRELNLMNNLIKTLPEGLFYFMLPNQVTTIKLDGNKWHCECSLIPFKMYLMENSNFVGTYKCSTPKPLEGYIIVDTDFCETYVPPPTTQSSTTISTSTISTSTISASTPSTSSPTTEATTNFPTEPNLPEEFSQTCYEAGETERSNIVLIKSPRATLTVNQNENGDVMLEVDTLSVNFTLIWFAIVERETYYRSSDEIGCVIGATNSIPIYNLKEDTAYTFCLMDSTEKTVSPLDCISYTKKLYSEASWLLNGSKSLIISMVVVSCIISLFAGLAIGIFVLKTNESIRKRRDENLTRLNNVCINEVLKETFQSNSTMRKGIRMSNMTADSFNTKRTTNLTIDYYLDHSDLAPPLPARPYEEPIYAVVRDTGAVK